MPKIVTKMYIHQGLAQRCLWATEDAALCKKALFKANPIE